MSFIDFLYILLFNDVFPAPGLHIYWSSFWNSCCLANTWTLCVTWLACRLDKIPVLFILIRPCFKKGSAFMGIVLKYHNFANYLACLPSVLTSQRQGLYIHIFLVHCCIAWFLIAYLCLMDTCSMNEYVNVSIVR